MVQLDRQRPQDEGVAGGLDYTGAVWTGDARARPAVDPPYGTDPALAERIRAAKAAEAQRRALRPRSVSDRGP